MAGINDHMLAVIQHPFKNKRVAVVVVARPDISVQIIHNFHVSILICPAPGALAFFMQAYPDARVYFGPAFLEKQLHQEIRLYFGREEYRMSIIAWILFGLIVGIIGKRLMPERDPGGFFVTILPGIAGSLLGGDYCGL
jgi:hypothetical protein